MIISQKHKFIFIHNPKCAGQSIKKALGSYHDSSVTYWDHEYSFYLDRIVDKPHLWAKDISIFEEQRLALERFFVFGFVRNPYDRFLSAFRQFMIMNDDLGKLGIDEFAKSYTTQHSIRHDWKLVHFCPQYLFFFAGKKRIADFIGRLENLQRDTTLISGFIGLDFSVEHHIKSNANSLESDSLSKDSVRLINKLYERDFLLFDYPIIEPDQQLTPEVLTAYREKIESRSPSLLNHFRNVVMRLDSAEQQNKIYFQKIIELNASLDRIEHSLSWKITTPLRKIISMVKK